MTPAWVEDLLGYDGIRILDLREVKPNGLHPHNAGHIPGAIHLDLDHSVVAKDGRSLVSLIEFAGAMSSHGIGDEHFVVVYDEIGGDRAERLVRALQRFGHHAAAVIEGGYLRWIGEGRAVEQAPRTVSPASFTARDKR